MMVTTWVLMWADIIVGLICGGVLVAAGAMTWRNQPNQDQGE